MDLGIAGRKAIVCASSRGLGMGCARALAEAGCEVVINGRDEKKLAETAAELGKTGAKIIPVVADVGTPEGQKKLFAACPEPDILVNNNGGPPLKDFRELTRQQMIDGVDRQHDRRDRAHSEDHRRHGRAQIRPHRQHHLVLGEGAAARPRSLIRRARRPDRVPRGRRPHRRGQERHHQHPPARAVRHRSAALRHRERRARNRTSPFEQARAARMQTMPAKRFGTPEEFGAACAFLCSTQAGFITGQNLLLDGGAIPTAF